MKVQIMNRFPNLNDYTKMNSMIMKLNMNINTSVAAIYAMMLLLVACSQERTLFPTEKTEGAFKRIHFVQGGCD